MPNAVATVAPVCRKVCYLLFGFSFRPAPVRIGCGLLTLFLYPALNLRMGYGENRLHCALEALECFRAFDHIRFRLHQLQSWHRRNVRRNFVHKPFYVGQHSHCLRFTKFIPGMHDVIPPSIFEIVEVMQD